MARKGLPRKYAKMGFKKGWAAYKRTKAPARRRTTTRRRRPVMARRRYSRARRYVGRARSFGPRGTKSIIDGLLAGAAGGVAQKFLGDYGHPAACLGIGFFRNNTTLKTEGARELGAILVQQFTGGNGGAGGGFN